MKVEEKVIKFTYKLNFKLERCRVNYKQQYFTPTGVTFVCGMALVVLCTFFFFLVLCTCLLYLYTNMYFLHSQF